MEPIYWIVIFVVLLIIEICTLGLTTIWFAGGALAAFLLGLAGLGTIWQVAAFLVVSVVLLVVTRPVALKYFNAKTHKTNAESLIGKQGLVLDEVDTLKSRGLVEVAGQEWSAKTKDPAGVIPKGAVVSVEEIQGVKLIVKKKEEG